MAKTVTEIDEPQQYLVGVMDRADHHAHNVQDIVLALAGAIVWRKDGRIKVMARSGDMKNVLWFEVGDHRFALSYNHHDQAIEVRDRTTQGEVLVSFTNSTPTSEVREFFDQLRI